MVYLGLKHFSARMEAANFGVKDLAALREMARRRGCAVYVAVNTLLKPGDVGPAGRQIQKLARYVGPEALIVQDPGLPKLAREAGFSGEIHLSTLANVSHPAAVSMVAKQMDVSRVILPRELNLDEIRACADACVPGLSLEVFVHGALCYAVSGRCYWSSFLGGKSGLRGRCVQPCRRMYGAAGAKGRFFSCLDLGLDVLVRTLLKIPQVGGWKIEGRRKGPHYVHCLVTAYRLLRDCGEDPKAKKEALGLMERALGRPTTHYGFLPQRPFVPIALDRPTGSGALAGKTREGAGGKPVVGHREALLHGDLLRVGYQDEPWHTVFPVRGKVERGRPLPVPHGPGQSPPMGTPVFLIDRREPELARQIGRLETELRQVPAPEISRSLFEPARFSIPARAGRPAVLHVFRRPPGRRNEENTGLWIAKHTVEKTPRPLASKVWWWLPPVVWPDEETELSHLVEETLRRGARHYVLNAPWQLLLVRAAVNRPTVWAGPFCNLGNAYALENLRSMGFSGAIVSPELSRKDCLLLAAQSPLPLGIVVQGLWPLCVSRTCAPDLPMEKPLSSPKGEVCWSRRHGQNLWVYPGWTLDLTAKRKELQEAGYALFVHLHEEWPKGVSRPSRTGTFNWDLKLL